MVDGRVAVGEDEYAADAEPVQMSTMFSNNCNDVSCDVYNVYVLGVPPYENKQKEAGIGPFLKNVDVLSDLA